MLDHVPKEKEALSWAYALFWAGLTFVTVPYTRVAVTYVSDNFGSGVFTYTVVTLVLIAAAAALYSVRARMTAWSCFWLVGIAALIVYLSFGLAGGSPVEAVHYVQYGTLSVLLFRAFSHRIRDYSIYVAVTLTGATAGMIDETLQWLAPDRFFDLRDVWLNFKATALVQIALAAGMRPKIISGWPTRTSLRRLCFLSALSLGYLGLCLQNTPERVAAYLPYVPGLEFLNPAHSIMVEYGYLHGDISSYSFRSRLTSAELHAAAAHYAQGGVPDLDYIHEREVQGNYRFRELLLTNTYLYEARLHQLRRDGRLVRAQGQTDQGRRAASYSAAYWENAILNAYFPDTVRGTRYEWTPQLKSEVREQTDLTQPYKSSISTHLVTAFTSHQLAFLCIGGVLLFLLGARLCKRTRGQNI